MQIQAINNNYGNSIFRNNSNNKIYEKTIEQPVEKFIPSFGAKSVKAVAKKLTPLEIPNGMFKTQEEGNIFSNVVEIIRNIDSKNCSKSKYKKVAIQLLDEKDNLKLLSKVFKFIEKNAPEIQEKNSNEIFYYLFNKYRLLEEIAGIKKNPANAYDEGAIYDELNPIGWDTDPWN